MLLTIKKDLPISRISESVFSFQECVSLLRDMNATCLNREVGMVEIGSAWQRLSQYSFIETIPETELLGLVMHPNKYHPAVITDLLDFIGFSSLSASYLYLALCACQGRTQCCTDDYYFLLALGPLFGKYTVALVPHKFGSRYEACISD
jgi:hypothetical protein